MESFTLESVDKEFFFHAVSHGIMLEIVFSALSDQQKRVPVRVFAFTQAEVAACPSIVIGDILIHGMTAYALIDSGATHSFTSTECVRKLGRQTDQLEM